ncbi:hypothetical protein GJ496_007986 [Pomphorhynchus laevis]|nr:hypothetical protein GJ496_007986 [Pomphorhynchus laevis]
MPTKLLFSKHINISNQRYLAAQLVGRKFPVFKYTFGITSLAAAGSLGYLAYVRNKGEEEINNVSTKFYEYWSQQRQIAVKFKNEYLPKRKPRSSGDQEADIKENASIELVNTKSASSMLKSPSNITFESAQVAINECLSEYPKLYNYLVSTVSLSDGKQTELPKCFIQAINECRQLINSDVLSSVEYSRIHDSLHRLINLIDVELLTDHFKANLDNARKTLNDELSVLTSLTLDTRVADNLLIAHAHCKIRELQAQLQAEQTLNEVKLEREVRKRYDQRISDVEVQLQTKVEKEQSEKLQKRIDDELHRYGRMLQGKHEEALQRQKEQLQLQMEEEMEKSILEILVQTHNEIAEKEAKLELLQHMLKTQTIAEQRSKQAQQVWIEANRLKDNALANADRLSVLSNLHKMSTLPGRSPLSDTLINLLADQMTRGPLTNSNELIDRFKYVRRIADRLIGVDRQNSNRLTSYAKSYVKSIWRRLTGVQKVIHLNKDSFINLQTLTNEEILAVASGFVLSDDLSSAVRILLLLKGEPRQAVSSWIDDTVNYLVIKQNCDLILALATGSCLYNSPQISGK